LYTTQGLNLSNDLAVSLPMDFADETVSRAKELLDESISKFQAAAAISMFNWGNVYMCRGRKKMDGGREPPVEEGGAPGAAIAIADSFDEVEELFNLAKERFEKALSIKPDHHDSLIALAQRRYERARLLAAAAGLSGEGGKVAAGHDGAKRTAEAEAEFAGASADYDAVLKTLEALPEEGKKEKTEEEKAQFQKLVDEAIARGEEPPSDEEVSLKSQVKVMLGNTHFEHSQMLARLGKDWKPLFDVSLKIFTEAGCAQSDIDGAIKMHRGKRMEAGK
jgi:tetratricopeptide (TPR) repeat protein